jgi:hypothetical protein
VEAFCFRKLEVARDVRRALAEGTELEHAVTTRMQWLEEEARLRRAIHWREEKEIEVLRRAVEALATARQSTATIARATDEALSRHPAYAHEPARAYEILWELAQLSFEILERAETAFSERPTEAVEPTPDWTEEVHKQLVRSIRQAHKEPLDIFPLAEVAVVGYEIRRVTEAAAELAAALVRRAS